MVIETRFVRNGATAHSRLFAPVDCPILVFRYYGRRTEPECDTTITDSQGRSRFAGGLCLIME